MTVSDVLGKYKVWIRQQKEMFLSAGAIGEGERNPGKG